MVFALVSIITCPKCGEIIPVTSTIFYDDPDIAAVKCPNCGFDIQVRHEGHTKIVVEPLKKH
jgi:transcription elongation factor Elf1